VAPVLVVVVDERRHLGAGLRFGGEVLEPAQFELQRGVPGFDGGVVQRLSG
jgi:hypothetical protein